MNIRLRLERVEQELQQVSNHATRHEGIEKRKALMLENECQNIIEHAATIAAACRKANGDRSGEDLVRRVRAALGFVKP